MKLLVRVVEARNLPSMDLNGFSDPYVRLQLGKNKSRTKVVKKCLNPSWGEEFTFQVKDHLNEELLLSVYDEDEYFNDDFIGQLKFPISRFHDEDNKSLTPSWYALEHKNKKPKAKECGEILLSIYFPQSPLSELLITGDQQPSSSKKTAETPFDSPSRSSTVSTGSPSSSMRLEELSSFKEEKSSSQKSLTGRIAQMFNKSGETPSPTSSSRGHKLLSEPPEIYENTLEDESSSSSSSHGTFEEVLKTMVSKDQGFELPSNLPGGVLLDQLYLIAPQDLNSLLFATDADFPKALAEVQGTTELQYGPWKLENEGENLKRVITYIQAASKLIKATKATEEQTYLKADGNNFAVLASVSTPDVIYGGTFKTEILYCITPGPELPSGEQSSRLVISWRMNFIQSTMMKGMIEGGARQGLRDNFVQYAGVLSQSVAPVDSKDIGSSKEQLLASLQAEPQSDWKLAVQYFGNLTTVSTLIIGFYVMVHLWLATASKIQGLEFVGLDLPDSIGEVVVAAILVLQGKQVLELISRFMQARVQKGSDHGVKAQGNGWLLTVALMEGSNLAAVDSSGLSDPYVVFTCNGKTRTSSIKFQKTGPVWNEIFEFDAMDEPPSVLDVEVYDFDGPFDEAASLGQAEINFVKNNISELADIWVPLQGKLAQACQSKLHLRIFLNNSRGSNVVQDYLTKMEKEVGKKINVRSPQTNSAFQKLFGLPPEEFLINDFTCHLKRKMPVQGRLFLSPRIIGFHANLFGHKTKFDFLWEDIEEIQVLSPTLASMGSPIILMTLRKGKGTNAKHGAKTQDEDGRLKFHFQTFVSFDVAQRTIMALWKARALSPEQKVQIVEEQSETKVLQSEESGTFLVVEDVAMSEVYSSALSVSTKFLMELFSGSDMERRVMEKAGCADYSYSPWELEKPNVYQRQIYYKFDKRVSRYSGEVTSTQQRSLLGDKNGWVVEEVMTLHAVPLGDYFNLHLKYQAEDLASRTQACNAKVFFGISWLKSTKQQKKISKNILSNFEERFKTMFSLMEKELTAET